MTIAYLTGEYPRATDTFIQREVAGLRAAGLTVETCTIRQTGPEHLTGPEQQAEAARTWPVLRNTLSPGGLAGLAAFVLRHPGAALAALALAWSTAATGLRGRAYALIYWAEAVTLARHLRRIRARHLHNHIAKASGTVAMLAAPMAGITHSFTLHGPDDLAEPGHWRLDQKIARAGFVACISDYARAQAMLVSGREHWGRLHVIHCGVDPARYAAAAERPGNRLLFVGRLAAVKGVPLLLQALAEARQARPDLRLTLVGDGPERPALQAEAKALGLAGACDFVGYQSQQAVADLLSRHDALVLPSFAEGVPVVLMEAMAARLPVIATRVAGVPELVEDGVSGLLIPPGDPAPLTAAILRLMTDPDLRARMGEAGRARVARDFDAGAEAARLALLFRGALAGDPPLPKRPDTPLPPAQGQVGVVAIGRNEGDRLRRCLTTLKGEGVPVVYVDSGSTDGSVALAEGMGIRVVHLDQDTPFTAARARNAGARALLAAHPVDYIQFIDGDCAVEPGWLSAGRAFLDRWPTAGLVTGWRAEVVPGTSVYNAICDWEWHRPAGPINACGGDLMVRAGLWAQVGGFADALICAEDEDFVIRLRQTGAAAHRLPLPMTRHDAAMTRFGQWWRRAVRAGHGFAEVGRRHSSHYAAERRRVWLWALILPLAVGLALAWGAWGWALAGVALYPLSWARTALGLRRGGMAVPLALRIGGLLTLSKWPNLVGMLTYHARRLRGAEFRLIEYK
jgi:glycosyltransferase involved in cell wall biosynthesis/GT2 family glycosyltransferase